VLGFIISLIIFLYFRSSLRVTVLNGFILEPVPHIYRVIGFCVVSLLGLVGLAFSFHISFWFAIASIIFVGSASSFGENCLIGYMKIYPSSIVSGWSSGTGTAGIGGSLLYLLFQSIGLSNTVSFLILTPLTAGYFLVFVFLLKKPTQSVDEDDAEAAEAAANAVLEAAHNNKHAESTSLLGNDGNSSAQVTQEVSAIVSDDSGHEHRVGGEEESNNVNADAAAAAPKEFVLKRYWRIFKSVFFRAANVCIYIGC